MQFNQYNVLKNAVKVSTEVAKKLAETKYEKFRIKQDQKFLSDFDNEINRIKTNKLDIILFISGLYASNNKNTTKLWVKLKK